MAGIARRTWHSLFFTLQSNFFSAGFIRSSKLTLCEYPARCSFRRNRWTCSLSAALAQPHHAGAAYRRRLIVVALHTVNSALSCNPLALRMRSAYVEEAHLLMISSTWDVTYRSFVNRTPRIFSSETLSIPSRDVPGTNFLPGTEYRVLRRFFTGSGYRVPGIYQIRKSGRKVSLVFLLFLVYRQLSMQHEKSSRNRF